MGDWGSLFLGWVLAASALLTCAAGSAGAPAPLAAAACALLLLSFVAVVDTSTGHRVAVAGRTTVDAGRG